MVKIKAIGDYSKRVFKNKNISQSTKANILESKELAVNRLFNDLRNW